MSDPIQAITMPKWGLAMEEGKVVAWLVDEGASVAAGQEILEIETTKITNVFEAPAAGTLRRRVVAEGETVPVGALLALVADPGVAEAELDAFVARFTAEFSVAAAAAEAAAPQRESVDAGGFGLSYLRLGSGGAPVVMIHGFGGDLDSWMFNQPVLAEDHEVLAFDLPGHGRSTKEVGTADMAMLVRTLGAFLDAVGIERAHLVGHSMGGALAMAFTLRHGPRVTGLTLVAPGGLGPEINMGFINGFIAANKRKDAKAVLEQLVANPQAISREMIDLTLKYKRLDGVDQALRKLADGLCPAGRQRVLDRNALAGIAVPVTVIWGEDDRILPVAHADGLPASFAVHRLPGIGHMPHMEAAGEVNRLIRAGLG